MHPLTLDMRGYLCHRWITSMEKINGLFILVFPRDSQTRMFREWRMTHRFCQSCRVMSPSPLWARGWAHVSSTLLWWTGRSDFAVPPSLGFWPPGDRQIGKLSRCPSRCQTARKLSNWWQRWELEGGQYCQTRHLEGHCQRKKQSEDLNKDLLVAFMNRAGNHCVPHNTMQCAIHG